MKTSNDGLILGIGNDIVEIERIRSSIKKYDTRFLSKLFTSKEQAYCLKYKDPSPHFAGRFCAKEAIAKALGTGFGKETHWLDIEILNNAHGKPEVHFLKTLKKRLDKTHVLLSISHCKQYATAFAIWLKS